MQPINGLVHLRVPGYGELVSRVVEHDGDSLTLRAPLAEGGGQVIPDPAQPLDIGVVSGRGIEWFSAVVAALGPAGRCCRYASSAARPAVSAGTRRGPPTRSRSSCGRSGLRRRSRERSWR
ncbi:MAG: hypothetical protein U0R69_06290 [Gaiellales bacterium]